MRCHSRPHGPDAYWIPRNWPTCSASTCRSLGRGRVSRSPAGRSPCENPLPRRPSSEKGFRVLARVKRWPVWAQGRVANRRAGEEAQRVLSWIAQLRGFERPDVAVQAGRNLRGGFGRNRTGVLAFAGRLSTVSGCSASRRRVCCAFAQHPPRSGEDPLAPASRTRRAARQG